MEPLEGTLVFRIVTEDVGCTQAAEIYLGPYLLGKWLTGTGHADTSIGVAARLLSEALKPLINASMLTECSPFEGSDWDPYKDMYEVG